MKLRDYQKAVVLGISDAFREGKKGVIMQMATGAGKTATAGYIVGKYAETKRVVLWLAHREELLLQASMTFSRMGVEHQLIAATDTARKCKIEQFRDFGKVFLSPTAVVYVASVQTLIRRLDKFADLNPALIVADECHLSLNKTFRTIIGGYPQARLLGLTATPTREDKQDFARAGGGLYDDMVCGPQVYELIDAGMLAQYDVFVPPVRMKISDNIKMVKGDYDPKALDEDFKNSPDVYGDVIEHYRKLSHGKPAIGFCPTVERAREFTERFCAAGYNAKLLEGGTDPAERYRTLKDLAVGKVDVVMSVDILIEGTDVPLATTFLGLRKTKSLRIYLQSVGRVLRPHEQKEKAIILDFVGISQIHGYPDDHREWSLSGNTKRRARPKKENDDGVSRIQTCPECYKAHEPAPACPNCGHEYTAKEKSDIVVVEGDLIKIERQQQIEKAEHAEIEKKVKRIEEGSCKTLEDWIALAKQREYRFPLQWATRRYELRCRRKTA
jgi:DNA repair protein RadD